MTYSPAPDRYDRAEYRLCGHSGLKLPPISLGLWHNFGFDRDMDTQRQIIRTAFDNGVTHFDLANNYGPPAGSAEENFGRVLARDFSRHRDEMVISSKAGWDMWDGPYGFGGSRKYLISSLDQSLKRLGVDYVDIYYHHRPDPETPLEESMYALRDLVASGKALYVGISSYGPELTAQAAAMMAEEGVPLLIHQPSYSILNRWIEQPGSERRSLIEECADHGLGIIAFSPLAQGLLTDRYLDGIPADSRAGAGKMNQNFLSEDNLAMVRRLHEIASDRGQSLAQMAIAWVLRDARVTSTIIGASSVDQLKTNLGTLESLEFSNDELAAIDAVAHDAGINQWESATKSRVFGD